MEDNSFVKLYRKSLKSSVFNNPIFWKVWCWCLMKATYKDKEHPFNGEDIKLKEGEFITGIYSASEELKITPQNYRTAIKYLKSTHRITSKSTNRFTKISVIKWAEYQYTEEKLTSQSTSNLTIHQQTTNKPLTTNKKDKKDKKEDIATKVAEGLPPKEEEKEFNLTSYLDGMKSNKNRHINIIRVYWLNKEFNFETQAQAQAQIKRDVRAAKDLVDYPNERIVEVMEYCKKRFDDWKLETVGKYINNKNL